MNFQVKSHLIIYLINFFLYLCVSKLKTMGNKNIIYLVIGIALIGGTIAYFWLNKKQPSKVSENKTKQDRVIKIQRA
jgi:LPXTG-motif cell wall-anchored protein